MNLMGDVGECFPLICDWSVWNSKDPDCGWTGGYLRLAVSTISTRVSSTTSAAELMMCSTFGVL